VLSSSRSRGPKSRAGIVSTCRRVRTLKPDLLRLSDQKAALHRILERIAGETDRQKRTEALTALSVLARLRRLSAILEEQRTESKMPIVIDWVNDEEVGPIIQSAREEGRREGRQQEGRQLLLRQIEKRFGSVPDWAVKRLDALDTAGTEDLALRLLDAPSLNDLLG